MVEPGEELHLPHDLLVKSSRESDQHHDPPDDVLMVEPGEELHLPHDLLVKVVENLISTTTTHLMTFSWLSLERSFTSRMIFLLKVVENLISTTTHLTTFSWLSLESSSHPVLWNRIDLLRFRFRLWKSSGSGSGSSFGYGSGCRQYLAQFFNKIFKKSCLFNVRSGIISQKVGILFLIFNFFIPFWIRIQIRLRNRILNLNAFRFRFR
jgi:hypothetical protein